MIAALQEISVLEVVAAWLRESPGLYSLDMPTPSGTSGLHAGLFPRVCHKWSEDMNDCRGPSDSACCIQKKPTTTTTTTTTYMASAASRLIAHATHTHPHHDLSDVVYGFWGFTLYVVLVRGLRHFCPLLCQKFLRRFAPLAS